MATSKPPYDPVKTVEGMFMGSVTRIAYALRDPANFAQSTKTVLAETAKKFQDALDDCHIQIHGAKWYLEAQLELNKSRREAKAREDNAASVKRKREEIQDAQDKTAPNVDGENAPKRVKTQEPEETSQPQPKRQQPSPLSKSAAQPPASAPAKPATQPVSVAARDTATPAVKPPDKPKVSITTDTKSTQQNVPPAPKQQEKPPEPERTLTQTTTDEFPKPTPQDTPADGNDAFNFESMFGEPTGDIMGEEGNDIGFDLDNIGGEGFDGDATNMNSVHDTSLNSLLPGLESYANQAGDDTGFNMSGAATNGVDTSGGGGGTGQNNITTNSQQTSQPQQQPPAQEPQLENMNDFSLPQLGPNEFDEFLNANDMNFDGNMNLDGDGLMGIDNLDNLDNMDNMDFESMFS